MTKNGGGGIIGIYGVLLYKTLASLKLAQPSAAMPIDGVVKMPLQASIFTPGRMAYIDFIVEGMLMPVDGVVKMPLQASIFIPGKMAYIDFIVEGMLMLVDGVAKILLQASILLLVKWHI